MRRSAIVHIAFITLAAGVAACAESPTAPTFAPESPAPVTGVVSSPSGAAAVLSVSAPDAIDCGGVADVTFTLTGRDEPRPLDVVVMMDASAGIGSANFTLMKSKVNALIDAFSWSSTGNRMAIIQFAGNATAWHPFGSPQSATALKATVSARSYTGGASWMRSAVQLAISQFDTYNRAGARKVIILITDGRPNPLDTQSPCSQAAFLAERGVHTFVFGLGDNWTSSVVSCLTPDPTAQIYSPPNAMDNMITALRSRVETRAGVQNVTVSATIPSGFTLEGTPVSDAGSVLVNGSTISWSLAELGAAPRTMTLRARSNAGSGPVLTSMSLNYWVGSTHTSQLVSNLGVQVASCDVTPPVIAANISGTLGNAGWYVSNVSIAWNVSDAESPHTITSGCQAGAVNSDTEGMSFSCSAGSAGGSATATETIRRDATPPAIAFTGNQINYFITDVVNISCTVSDATSGTVEATCPSVNQPGWSFGLGRHTLSASALDAAGNRATLSTQFNVVVTHAALCQLTRDWVSEPRQVNKMCELLEVARRLGGAAGGTAAQMIMRVYVRSVEGLPSAAITTDHRGVLVSLAAAL